MGFEVGDLVLDVVGFFEPRSDFGIGEIDLVVAVAAFGGDAFGSHGGGIFTEMDLGDAVDFLFGKTPTIDLDIVSGCG